MYPDWNGDSRATRVFHPTSNLYRKNIWILLVFVMHVDMIFNWDPTDTNKSSDPIVCRCPRSNHAWKAKNFKTLCEIWMFPKLGVPPKSSILIGFSIIFTIHFGVPLFFGNTHMTSTSRIYSWLILAAGRPYGMNK